jgi:outer membrane protein assembly factor BamB
MHQVWTAEIPTLDGLRYRYGGEPENHRNDQGNRVDHPIFDSSPVVKMWAQNGQTTRRVFVGGFNGTYSASTGRLYCFDFTGTNLWTYPASGQSALSGGVASTPAVAWVNTATGQDLRVFFGAANGILYALSAVSGELRWQYDTGAMILASPVVSKGVVYVGNEMDELMAVDAVTGDEVFTTVLDQSWQNGVTGTSSPIVAEVNGTDYVFVTSDDGRAYKVYAAGDEQQGQIAATYTNFNLQCLEGSPSFKDGVVYFGNTLVVPEYAYNMYGLDATSFDVCWNGRTTAEVRTTPALCSDGVYVGDETGQWLYRFGFEPDWTEPLQQLNTGYHVFSSQSLTSGLVFCGNDLGQLQARCLTDLFEPPGNKLVLPGAEDPTGSIGGPISSSAAICYTLDNGVWRRWVFVTSRNGYVYDDNWNQIAVPSVLHAFSSQP